MQFLRGYSSDSEEEDTENHERFAEESEFPKAKRPAHNPSIAPSSCSLSDQDIPPSTSTTSQKLPPLDPKSFVTYSEEYSMNRHKKLGAFVYIPWRPSKQTHQKLRQVNDLALQTVRNTVPDFGKRYLWNSNLSSTAVFHGKFGHTNKNAINALHTTLFPNLYGPAHLLPQIAKNLERATKAIQVPPSLILDKASKLDALLGSQKLRFALDPQITLFQSPKTSTVFLGIKIKKFMNSLENPRESVKSEYEDPEPKSSGSSDLSMTVEATDNSSQKSPSTSPEHQYLVKLTRAIGTQVDLLKFNYKWAQFSSNPKIAHDNSLMEYHLTLLVCEPKPLTKHLSLSELKQIRSVLNEIPTKDLEGVTLEADSMLIQTNNDLLPIKLI